jgi:hypothetical protein
LKYQYIAEFGKALKLKNDYDNGYLFFHNGHVSNGLLSNLENYQNSLEEAMKLPPKRYPAIFVVIPALISILSTESFEA